MATPDLRPLDGATYNCRRPAHAGERYTRTPGQVHDFLSHFCRSRAPAFMLLQETADYLGVVHTIPGYHPIVFPGSPDHGDNAILVRHDVDHGPGWPLEVVGSWRTVRGGQAPARTPLTVQLNGWLRVCCVHPPPSVTWRAGIPTGPARRIRVYRNTTRRLLTFAEHIEHAAPAESVLIGGDWNGRRGDRGPWSPTWLADKADLAKHDGGHIDWVMTRHTRVDNITVDHHHNGGSDHPIVTFTAHRDYHPTHAPAMGTRAIARARTESRRGPLLEVGMCLENVRDCYDIGPGAPTAIAAWERAAHKHPTSNPATIPRGYPIMWSGGSRGAGHIAIGAGHGWCWSTDIARPGRFDRVPVARVHTQWGLTLEGWTQDLNGVSIR
jgi:hypothetical protein